MRTALGIMVFVHGLIHTVGFIGPMQLVPQTHFQTVLFGRALDNASSLARAMALLWLLEACALCSAALSVLMRTSWWFSLTTTALLASSVLCVIAWPATKVGLAANAALLALSLFAARAQLWSDLLGLFRVLPR